MNRQATVVGRAKPRMTPLRFLWRLLLAFVKLADELPLAAVPKDGSGSAMVASPAGAPTHP